MNGQQICDAETLKMFEEYGPQVLHSIRVLEEEDRWSHEYDYYPGRDWKEYTHLIQQVGNTNPAVTRFFRNILREFPHSFTLWYAVEAVGEQGVPLQKELIELINNSYDPTTRNHTQEALAKLERSMVA